MKQKNKLLKPEKLTQRVHRSYLLNEAENFREHKKGIPEWLKNADDSYNRQEEFHNKDYSKIPILVNFSKKEITCIDFGGADGQTMKEHIPYYGSPDAATQGRRMNTKTVSGGHGNGGKYYALSQFKECKVISYYNQKISILTLNPEGDFVEVINRPCSYWEAIKIVGLDKLNCLESKNNPILTKLRSGEIGLFCWKGISPKDLRPFNFKVHLSKLIDSIANHPQSRSALRSRVVDILWNGNIFWPALKPKQIEVDLTFGTKEFILPNKLGDYEFNRDGKSVLRITLSKDQLAGDKSSLNILEIDARGKNISFYDLPSFTLDRGYSKYLTAQIDCPELKETYKCVTNDRVQLKDKDVTDVFLSWCRDKIQEVLDTLRNKEKTDAENKDKENLGIFLNEVLNEFQDLLEEDDILKRTYDPKGEITEEIKTPSDGKGYGGKGKIKKKGDGQRKGNLEDKKDKSSEKKGKSTLKILVSNSDDDPLSPQKGVKYNMIDREPVLNQRVQDIPHGIWWINSQKKYIKGLKVKETSSWPFYFLLVKEIVYSHRQRKKFKDGGEGFAPDALEQLNFDLIDEVFNRAVDKFKIRELYDENTSEKIGSTIKQKQTFTVPDIAKELEVDPMSVHAFIMNNQESIDQQFTVIKEEKEGHKGMVNVYTKK